MSWVNWPKIVGPVAVLSLTGPAFSQDNIDQMTVEQAARTAVSIAKGYAETIKGLEERILSLTPEECDNSQAPIWTGSEWACRAIIQECQVCTRLTSNSNIDGAKECSDWSSAGQEMYTGVSGWAESQSGSFGGGKYSVGAWITCR